MKPKSKKTEKDFTHQMLSPMAYMLISLVGLGVAAALLIFLVYHAPTMTSPALGGRIFYFTLIPLGLAAAAFIFGGMRSLAHFSGKVFSGTIELGGPIVAACLTVVGGFLLVPVEAEKDFSLRIRVYGPDGRGDHEFAHGQVVEVFFQNGESLDDKLDARGEVEFMLSYSKRLQPFEVTPKIEGYVAASPAHFDALPQSGLVEIAMERKAFQTSVRGVVYEGTAQKPRPAAGVVLDFNTGLATDTTDQFGRFNLVLPCKPGDQVHVQAWKETMRVYDNVLTILQDGQLPPIYAQ